MKKSFFRLLARIFRVKPRKQAPEENWVTFAQGPTASFTGADADYERQNGDQCKPGHEIEGVDLTNWRKAT